MRNFGSTEPEHRDATFADKAKLAGVAAVTVPISGVLGAATGAILGGASVLAYQAFTGKRNDEAAGKVVMVSAALFGLGLPAAFLGALGHDVMQAEREGGLQVRV